MDQPNGELRNGVRRRQRQRRFNVHMPAVDYGVVTAVVAMAFRQVENEADIKRKADEESNKKMRFPAPRVQVKQHSTTFRPGQQLKSAGPSHFVEMKKVFEIVAIQLKSGAKEGNIGVKDLICIS
ncbi:hypothetical protein ACH5RR_018176 [Cinchona calisaya]|uniref:Uncharacterized protein n=1 Tax=Cinchona calisaya TaxID=153742 RepID=A0ABD2ZNK7_9GENT